MALSDKQLAAAQHIAAGLTTRQAGEKVGCDQRTICYWNETKEFRAEVQRLRKATWDTVIGKLVGASNAVIDKLVDIALDPNTSTRDSISAIKEVMAYSQKSFENMELDSRIQELEDLQDGKAIHIDSNEYREWMHWRKQRGGPPEDPDDLPFGLG